MQLSLSAIFTLSAFILGNTWGKVYFEERFDDGAKWEHRWVVPSKLEKLGKFGLSSGKWFADKSMSAGIQTLEDARFYAISAKFKPFSNKKKTLVVQLTVKHEQVIDCGGGYLKLLPQHFDQSTFSGDTPYLIMFGPDICGNKRQVHDIIYHNEKNHLIKKHIQAPSDDLTHIYTLVIRPDQSYSVFVDGEEEAKGTLIDDWSILPPKTIPDPAAKKPDNWVEEREIIDPEDKKPADYDDSQPETIPDESVQQPADYDEEKDGPWERPKKLNPLYKKPWKPRMIKNPEYKGPWVAPQIPNPDFKTDDTIGQFDDIGAVGIEVWQVKSGTIFDNILITDSIEEAEEIAKKVYKELKEKEVAARDAFNGANKPKEEEPAVEEKKKEVENDNAGKESAAEKAGDKSGVKVEDAEEDSDREL